MFRRFALLLVCFLGLHACAYLPRANCDVVGSQGELLASLKPAYASVRRRPTLHRIDQQFFVELYYNYRNSSVTVTLLKMPHYPWTVSESVLARRVLEMTGDEHKQGAVSLDLEKPNARLICRERTH